MATLKPTPQISARENAATALAAAAASAAAATATPARPTDAAPAAAYIGQRLNTNLLKSPDPETADQLAEIKGRNLEKVTPAALRIATYFVRNKPRLLTDLVLAEKIDRDDFEAMLHFIGSSSAFLDDRL